LHSFVRRHRHSPTLLMSLTYILVDFENVQLDQTRRSGYLRLN